MMIARDEGQRHRAKAPLSFFPDEGMTKVVRPMNRALAGSPWPALVFVIPWFFSPLLPFPFFPPLFLFFSLEAPS